MNEVELVEKIIKGEEKAVRELYRKYSFRLLNFILLKIDSRQDAEEVLQDTFVSALDTLPLFAGQSSLFTWLAAIAKHEVADFYRKQKIKKVLFSRLPFLERLASQVLGPEEELAEKEMKKRVGEVLEKLSEGYRQILRLKYEKGYQVADIGRKLGITSKAAESRLTRARLAFRKIWVQENERLDQSLPEKDFLRSSS